ncbi:MAG: hypothetical protein MI919_08730 [Holophagales bacterium]|nr:hypothetical protein [Holophagales bacterium]
MNQEASNRHGRKLTGLKTAMDRLAHSRDELRLQVRLAEAEARQEWEDLEDRWGQLRQRYQQIEGAAADAAEDVWSGVELLAEEITRGYEKIRRAL